MVKCGAAPGVTPTNQQKFSNVSKSHRSHLLRTSYLKNNCFATAYEMSLLPKTLKRRPERPCFKVVGGSEILEGTEYVPRGRRWRRFSYPILARIKIRSSPKSRCSFLRLLPIEVRQMVYMELWVAAGLVQHIYIQRGAYTHRPCLIDHRALDERQSEVHRLWNNEWEIANFACENATWRRRLVSQWCNHWRCEEAAASHLADPYYTRSPFLPMLLTCRET